jgi:Zn-dependent metalloprotease
VLSFNSLETQSGQTAAIGKTMYSGDVTLNVTLNGATYQLIDPTKGSPSGNTTYTNNNGFDTIKQIVTNTFRFSATTTSTTAIREPPPPTPRMVWRPTWNFYMTKFGRNGIDGTGRRTYSKGPLRQRLRERVLEQ